MVGICENYLIDFCIFVWAVQYYNPDGIISSLYTICESFHLGSSSRGVSFSLFCLIYLLSMLSPLYLLKFFEELTEVDINNNKNNNNNNNDDDDYNDNNKNDNNNNNKKKKKKNIKILIY
ncbi:hypothetical protein H8356DRAFT_1327225 [Neocallimastix lanati (nom. inval.)]|nr:hypothetical protein H8356DRAFT_1327225 [Neocallimastix sp. JGI-2020a]